MTDETAGEVVDAEIMPADMDPLEARAITDQIRAGLEQVWELVERAYLQRAWLALGHASWDDYCAAEFDTDRLQIPRRERPQVVAMLRQAGLSIRAIAAATDLSVGTVHRAIEAAAPESAPVPNGTPDRAEEPIATVTGIDGKRHPAKRPVKPRKGNTLPDEVIELERRHAAARGTADDPILESGRADVVDDDKPDTAEAAAAAHTETDDVKKLAAVLLKYTNQLGQRLAEAKHHGMNLILTLDEAERLYTMLGDAVAVVNGNNVVYFDCFEERS